MDTLAECAQSKAEEQNCGENRFGAMHIDLLSDGSIRLMQRKAVRAMVVSSGRRPQAGHIMLRVMTISKRSGAVIGGASGIATRRCYVRRLTRFCLAHVLFRDNGWLQPLRLMRNVYRLRVQVFRLP